MQNFIARRVAVQIIDRLELFDIHDHQDQGFLKLLFQLVKKRFSIPAFCGQRRPLRNEVLILVHEYTLPYFSHYIINPDDPKKFYGSESLILVKTCKL